MTLLLFARLCPQPGGGVVANRNNNNTSSTSSSLSSLCPSRRKIPRLEKGIFSVVSTPSTKMAASAKETTFGNVHFFRSASLDRRNSLRTLNSFASGAEDDESDKKEVKRRTEDAPNDAFGGGQREKTISDRRTPPRSASTISSLKQRVESSGVYGNVSTEGRKSFGKAAATKAKKARRKANWLRKEREKQPTEKHRRPEGRKVTQNLAQFINLNGKITRSKNIIELIDYIRSEIDNFSVVNVSTTLHRIGTLVRDSKHLRRSGTVADMNPNVRRRLGEGDDAEREAMARSEKALNICENILVDPVFKRLIQRLEQMLPRGDEGDEVNLTKIGKEYGTPSSREYTNCLWGLAHCGVKTKMYPNELVTILFQNYCNCVKENDYRLFSQNVSNALWAMTVMNAKNEDWSKGKDFVTYEPEAIVYITRDDFKFANFKNASNEEVAVRVKHSMLDVCERLCVNVMDDLVPQGIANSFWSFASYAGEYDLRPETQEAFKRGIASNLGVPPKVPPESRRFLGSGRFKQMECSNIIWACGQMRFDMGKELASMFLESMRDNLERNSNMWSTQSISNILWALASLKINGLGETYAPPVGLIQLCEEAASYKVHQMVTQGISNSLWGMANLEHMPKQEFLAILSERWDQVYLRLSTMENTNALWAFTKFPNFIPSPGLCEHIAKQQLRCTMVKETWSPLQEEGFAELYSFGRDTLTVMVFVNTIYSFAEINFFPNDGGAYMNHVLTEMTGWLRESYDPNQTNKNCTQPIVNFMRSLAIMKYLPGDDFVRVMCKRAKMEADNDQFTAQGLSQMLWSWALLDLKIPRDVVDALAHACLRHMDDFGVQALSNSMWGLATMGMMHYREVFLAFKQKLNSMPVEIYELGSERHNHLVSGGVKEVSLIQLYQAHFAYELLSPHGKLLESELEAASREKWLEVTRDFAKISKFHREVSSTLTEMQVPHELEYVTEDGLFSLDIALKGRRICVEIDGPSHFAVNRPKVRLGGDNLRNAVFHNILV